MKPSVLVALLVVLVLGFAIGHATAPYHPSPAVAEGSRPSAAPAPAIRPVDPTVFKVPLEGSPIAGAADALVTLVEFSDYQCPFCSRANTTVEQMQREYGGKLRVVMKEFPLPFHPNAKPGAMAALAAGEQGKYWEMHKLLFDHQSQLEAADLEARASKLGLDVSKWKADLTSEALKAHIDRDLDQGRTLGVSGTPAFFINGRRLSGAQPPEAFRALIDEELKKAERLTASGTPASEVYAKLMEHATARAEAPAQAPTSVKKIDVPSDSPAWGPKAAKVTIVEWSDFQCPFCSRALPSVKKIEETYPHDVRIIWRNEPLPFHNNARIAAQAAMAAHEQGKFWPMHDKLFANQGALDRDSLERYAQELGLNMAKFKAAMDGEKVKAKIDADNAAGLAAGANGTPNFFINGVQLVGAQPFEAFKPIIDQQIAKADALLAKGVKLDQVYDRLMAEAGSAPPAANVQVGSAPVFGPRDAPVTIVEFSDFQCPYCGKAYQTVKTLEDQYAGKVKVAFKNDPLPFHNNARPAAMAALAAGEQGKFWEYHDLLFTHQQALDRASLEQYAEQLHLNMPRFKAALDSNKFDAQIASDTAEGGRLGVDGTPAFFINGQKIVGAVPIDQFKSVIDRELAKRRH